MAENEQQEVAAYDYDRELYRCPISWPITSEKAKMTKKLYVLIKKTVVNNKKDVIKGINDVTKALRKGQKGILVLGADASPYDVISHLPLLAEESDVPYVWVPSRQDLGTATQCKRATSVVLLKPTAELRPNYDKMILAIEDLNTA